MDGSYGSRRGSPDVVMMTVPWFHAIHYLTYNESGHSSVLSVQHQTAILELLDFSIFFGPHQVDVFSILHQQNFAPS